VKGRVRGIFPVVFARRRSRRGNPEVRGAELKPVKSANGYWPPSARPPPPVIVILEERSDEESQGGVVPVGVSQLYLAGAGGTVSS
jgi:hypothetical protein